jgi:hypothetical protein
VHIVRFSDADDELAEDTQKSARKLGRREQMGA